MATLATTDIVDRTINSLNELRKGEWFDEMQTYQNYPMLRVARKMGKERSGAQLHWRIGVGSTNQDGHAGLYEDYDLDRPDVMTEAKLPWRHHRKGFAIDTRELDPRSAPEHVVDDMVVQRNDMFAQTADDIETGAWQVPAASDKLMPHGVPYFVPWLSTAAGSFHAGLPAGHTTIAEIDPAVQTKWQNWADTYSAYTRADLGLRLGQAIRNTGWRPPANVKGETQVSHAIYCDQTVMNNLEIMSADQNDQLGPDVQPMFGKSMIARINPIWVPLLDTAAAASSNPLYVLNHAYFAPVFKSGFKFREEPARKAAKQPLAVEVTLWTTYNWRVQSRRRQAVIAKAAPFGES